jgi:proline-specific peptidase
MHKTSALILALLISSAAFAQEVSRKQGYFEGADGARLFYEKVGAGADTLVLVHGTPSNMYSLARDFDDLAKELTLIFFDQRGGGRSEPLLEPDALSWQMHIRDIEALRVHFGLERMNLLGISWGSALVALYAAEYPQRIDRLVLVPMRARKNPGVPEGAREPPVTLGDEISAQISELRSRWETAEDPVAVCEKYWSILTPLLFYKPQQMRGSFCDEPADVLRHTWKVNNARINSLGDFDLRPMLAKVNCPTLVMKGTYTTMYREWTEEWAKALTNSRLLWIEDAGTFPWLDRPTQVLSAISAFLAGEWPEGAKVVQ